MAKTNKQKLLAKMDKLWSKLVRQCGYCAVCGVRTGLEAHHLIPRGNHLYRWDLYNGLCLCHSHHQFSSELSAHGRKGGSMLAGDRFMEWFKLNRPEQHKWYQKHKNDKPKSTIYMADYQSMYDYLKEADKPEF